MEPVLQAMDLCKTYGSTIALYNLNVTLGPGRIVGLLGPNGSGKTTFLKLCAGLLVPNSGKLTICGHEIGPESKALVSYLPDRTYLSSRQTIRQQLELFQDFYADFDRARAEEMLSRLNINPAQRFGTLSKGNKEKVHLVLAMSRRARLYLLDEPIGGVDPAARDYILSTIISNYDPNATVLISTHLINDVENVLDDFIFLHNGRVVKAGPVDEAREATGQSLDEQFREVFRCLPNF